MKRIAKQYKMIDPQWSQKKEENTKFQETLFVETESEKLMSRVTLIKQLWSLLISDKHIWEEIVGL